MRFFAHITIFLSISSSCFCNLKIGLRKGSENDNRRSLKCLETVIDVTHWAVHNFLLISDVVIAPEADFFKQYSNFGWRIHTKRNNDFTGFSNVIIFTENFHKLNETLSTVNIRRIDSRAKFVISVRQGFASLDEIRRASTGINAAMWKLDKTRVLFLVTTEDRVLAMTYFPFANNCEVGHLEILDTWRDNNFEDSAELFSEKMSNIQGCVQNHSVIFDEGIQLQIQSELTDTGKLTLGGIGGKLMTIVSEKMNMGLYLLPEMPESWGELNDQIIEGKSLFPVGGSMPIADCLVMFDIDYGYMQESFGFGYISGDFEVSWKNFIWPLSIDAWIYIGCIFLLFSGLIFLVNHLQITTDKFTILDNLGIFLGSSRSMPLSHFGRYFLGIWIIYSNLINAYYNSGLISFLTTPREMRVIKTLEDLLADGMDFGGGEFHQEFYNDPSDPVMMRIYDNFKIWSVDESFRVLMNKQGATGVIASYVSMYNSNHTDTGNHRLRMLEERAFTFHVPIYMRRGSPFVIWVHRYTSQVIQSGLLNYWLNHYTRTLSSTRTSSNKPIKISMEHLRGILYLYVVGLVFSSVVFFGEIVFSKYSSG